MLDTVRLNDWKERIDTITSLLAASNSKSVPPLSDDRREALLTELGYLNDRVEMWFALYFGCGRVRASKPSREVLCAVCTYTVLGLTLALLTMMLVPVMHDLTTSFIYMARPVP